MKINKKILEWVDKIRELEEDNDELLFEMANFFHTRHTELPSNIWISARNANYGPRIKIQRNKGHAMQSEETFSMTISDSPEIIGNIGELSAEDIAYFKNFVLRNKNTLLDYWNGILDTSDLTDKLLF